MLKRLAIFVAMVTSLAGCDLTTQRPTSVQDAPEFLADVGELTPYTRLGNTGDLRDHSVKEALESLADRPGLLPVGAFEGQPVFFDIRTQEINVGEERIPLDIPDNQIPFYNSGVFLFMVEAGDVTSVRRFFLESREYQNLEIDFEAFALEQMSDGSSWILNDAGEWVRFNLEGSESGVFRIPSGLALVDAYGDEMLVAEPGDPDRPGHETSTGSILRAVPK